MPPWICPRYSGVAGLMEHFLCITFSFSLNKSGIPVMLLWHPGVQGSSGNRPKEIHGPRERWPRRGTRVMGGVLKPRLRRESKGMDVFSPEGQAQGDTTAVFRHLKGCHGEEGQSLLCGLKGSNRDQPVEVTTRRFQGGIDRIPSAEAAREGPLGR